MSAINNHACTLAVADTALTIGTVIYFRNKILELEELVNKLNKKLEKIENNSNRENESDDEKFPLEGQEDIENILASMSKN